MKKRFALLVVVLMFMNMITCYGSDRLTVNAESFMACTVHAKQIVDSSQRKQLVGDWSGVYFASQGKTALVLQIISVDESGKVEAVFNFSEHPDNKGVPTGSYYMSGTYNPSSKGLSLDATEWINRPSSYNFVNIRSTVNLSTGVISGSTTGPTWDTPGLYLTKGTVPSDEGNSSLYDNYKGQGIKPLTVPKTVMDKTIRRSKKEEIDGAEYPLLQARAANVKATSFKIRWNKLKGATGYLVYGNKCGKKNKFEYIKETGNTSYKATKKKKNSFYKYVVVAVRDDKVIAVSKTVHVGTKTKPNPKKVKVNKRKVTLTKTAPGNTFTIKAKVKGTPLKQHRGIRCETDNVSVATVTNKGTIRAVGPGNCTVYVYAQNGVRAKIQVKVTE